MNLKPAAMSLMIILLTAPGLCFAAGPVQFPEEVRLRWQLVENQFRQSGMHLGRMTIINEGNCPLPDTGWALYFNWYRKVIPEEMDTLVHARHINGDFYEITPAPDFPVLAPGDSVTFPLVGTYYIINKTDAPSGTYFTWQADDGQRFLSVPPEIIPIDSSKCYRSEKDILPVWNAAEQYEQNKARDIVPIRDEMPVIIPTPALADFAGSLITLTSEWGITGDTSCFSGDNGLGTVFHQRLPDFPAVDADRNIIVQVDPHAFAGPAKQSGAYMLVIDPAEIKITGFDRHGLFYGMQTLFALEAQPFDHNGSLILPVCRILDYPRFRYRGMHVDVARNFHQPEVIKQLIVEMSRYKLNRLHFHLTDDEGWRLEIPGLPELTAIGAVRGHTLSERNHLVPSLGSGPFPSDPATAGSGFYTRDQFIDLLKYAAAHHIEVIPEIDLPGHAHAAIVSMNARYARFMSTGQTDAASEYLLFHPADTSNYLSIQKWRNNVVDVGMASTYKFFEKVVCEIRSMYHEAGLELKVVHIGGDEVSEEAWRGSPACSGLKHSDPDIRTNHDLLEYFVDRLGRVLAKYDIRTAGWEEIGIAIRNGKKVPNRAFADRGFIPHVWNSVWGWGGEDLAYRLANQGFEVVLSNASNLYFGLAHDKHPLEPGLYWAGFVSVRNVWEFTPTDIRYCTETDLMGHMVDAFQADHFEPLDVEAEDNIIGLQGHIWGENARSPEMLHYFVFPKLLAMAERAWAQKPEWEKQALPGARESDWSQFLSVLGLRELPRLAERGIAYRIPLPGAMVQNDTLYMNNHIPGLTAVYQIDNGNRLIYESPVRLMDRDGSTIRIWNEDRIGRQSRKTLITF